MLDFTPDTRIDDDLALSATGFTLQWDSETPPHDRLLSQLIATSSDARLIFGARGVRQGMAPSAFQPERMSGFCATN